MPTNRAIVSPEKQKYFAKAQDGFSELRCTKSPIHRLHSDKLAVKRVRKWLENTKQRGKRKKEKKKKKKKGTPSRSWTAAPWIRTPALYQLRYERDSEKGRENWETGRFWARKGLERAKKRFKARKSAEKHQKASEKKLPPVGLEPPTPTSEGRHSTDYATSATLEKKARIEPPFRPKRRKRQKTPASEGAKKERGQRKVSSLTSPLPFYVLLLLLFSYKSLV